MVDREESIALMRFMDKCPLEVGDDPNGCWIWIGGKTSKGYGNFSYRGRSVGAHRWIYELLVGPIPEGAVLDHEVCDTPACVNPGHCRPKSRGANTLRSKTGPSAVNARKTHCKHDHRLAGDNLYVTPNGRRMCRACQREREARWLERNPDGNRAKAKRAYWKQKAQ